MSSRFGKAVELAMIVLCAMAALALAQTSRTETSGQSGSGNLGAEIGLSTPESPTDRPSADITGRSDTGASGVGPGTTRLAPERSGMGVDRPGTRITEQPGAVSPGTGTPGSPTDRVGSMAGQSETSHGSNPTMPGAESSTTRSSGTGSPTTGATGDMGR